MFRPFDLHQVTFTRLGIRKWDAISQEHCLHSMLPYSRFCKDDLMTVEWPKHVVIKVKI
jgi:hypothetical protein